VSYSNELAAELHRQFRRMLEADWYQRLFPDTLLSKDTALEAVTTVGGGRYATSIERSLTGRGADLIIIDDPHKAEEAQSEKALAQVWEWYSGTLVSRLNDRRTGKIILVMQLCIRMIWQDACWQGKAGLTSSCQRWRLPTRAFRFAMVA